MTFRQIDFCLTQIRKRTNGDTKYQAKLHGFEVITPDESVFEPVNFSKAEEDAAEKAIQKMVTRGQ